jgi:hypothetical protein
MTTHKHLSEADIKEAVKFWLASRGFKGTSLSSSVDRGDRPGDRETVSMSVIGEEAPVLVPVPASTPDWDSMRKFAEEVLSTLRGYVAEPSAETDLVFMTAVLVRAARGLSSMDEAPGRPLVKPPSLEKKWYTYTFFDTLCVEAEKHVREGRHVTVRLSKTPEEKVAGNFVLTVA